MSKHQAVMIDEVVTSLNIKADGTYIDATFGRGGHTRAILEKLNATGKIFVIDKDPQAIQCAKEMQQNDARIQVFHGSNSNIVVYCEQAGIVGKVDGILLDLGVSSPQLETANRGFSFMQEGPLDMRMDPTTGITAAQWINSAEQDEIAYVLKTYGEEKFAKQIARAICSQREQQAITTTKMLADIIQRCYPLQQHRYSNNKSGKNRPQIRKHPATKSFQAIRIYINSELDDLQQLLSASISILATNGRLVVISFHSLEDRIVKKFINSEAKGDNFPADFPIRHADLHPRLAKIGKSQKPGLAEIEANIRARSAILRVAEKLMEQELDKVSTNEINTSKNLSVSATNATGADSMPVFAREEHKT